jgi:hypothetical protein
MNDLLRDALAPDPQLSRPPLPLRAGHVALLLAGGLCDSVIDDPVHGRFMVKGSLKTSVKKIRTDEKGERSIDVYRTRYALNVRVLRENGTLENYTSEPEEQE